MPRAKRLDSLTDREREVLTLLRHGLTNEEIADGLGITVAGAKYHVSQILSKLGVDSREGAAVWQPEEKAPRYAWWRTIVGLSLAAKIGGAVVLIAASVGLAALGWGVAETGSGGASPPGAASSVFDSVTNPNNWSGTGPVTVTDFEPDDTPKISLADAEAPYAAQDGVSIVSAQLVRIQVTTPIDCACPLITLPPSPISPTPTPSPSPTPRLDTYLAWAIRLDTSQAFGLSDPSGGREGWGRRGQVPWVVALVNANANDGTWIALYDGPASASPTPTHIVGNTTPSPFLFVLNENDPDITISPWDGASLTTLSCPNDVSFQMTDGPASPWHYVVRDATSGQILHEDTISDDGDGIYIVEARDGQILSGRDIMPSGPINPSRKPCPNVSP